MSQNWACRIRPPGVGEQQVFWMEVVFSQEITSGSLAQAATLERVFGIENDRSLVMARTVAEA